jgi:ferritin
MGSKKLFDAFNRQLNQELNAAYLYLSLAAHFDAANHQGFATWMRAQSAEENQHALKFWEHIYSRGGKVDLLAIEKPRSEFHSPLDAFEAALHAEKENTQEIHKLYELAVSEKDYPAQVFLNFFIEEQVEEENTAQQIVDTLKQIGDSSSALLMLDRELGQRGIEGNAI